MDASLAGAAPLYLLAVAGLFGLFLLIGASLGQAPVALRAAAHIPRPLKPKTGDNCPLCQGPLTPEMAEAAWRTPRPWSEVQSPRGPKKHSATEGYACDNLVCEYYGITDATIHGLIAFGGHGKQEWIQDLYCQACKHKFTVRRHTVPYRLKTHSVRVAEALTFLAEGVDVSVLERIWGIGEGTLRTWLTRAGLHAAKLHNHFFQRLNGASGK